MYRISKTFAFSASHQLHGLPADHPCSRVHGHNYDVTITLTGRVNDVGMVVDYRELAPVKEWIDDTLDHRHLNDVPGLEQPTAENMARVLAQRFAGLPVIRERCTAVMVAVSETPKTLATYELAL